MKKSILAVVFSSCLVLCPNTYASAATPDPPAVISASAPTQPTPTAEQLDELHRGLAESNTPRHIRVEDGVAYEVFEFDKDGTRFSLAFPDKSDRVSGGADSHGPYIDLDPSEQGASAAGLAYTIGGVICAALGPETAGIGCIAAAGIAGTVVAVATSHGVCPNSRVLRIHIGPTIKPECL